MSDETEKEGNGRQWAVETDEGNNNNYYYYHNNNVGL